MVELRRANAALFLEVSMGHFSVQAIINGFSVPMLVDTGATITTITYQTAYNIGIPVSMLDYSIAAATANGRTFVAPITLSEISVNSITETNIEANVSQDGALFGNLLGMNFLDRLESWEVRDGHLTMRGRGNKFDDIMSELDRLFKKMALQEEQHRIEREEWDRRLRAIPPPEPIKTSEVDYNPYWSELAEALADKCDEEGIDYPGKQYRRRQKPKPYYTDNVLPFVLRKMRREHTW
jgi:clan AA aspartic protease (TIGR02281 family)